MKSISSIINPLANRLKSHHYTNLKILHCVKATGVKDNAPGLKTRLIYIVNHSSENAAKHEKTKLIIKNMVSIRCKMVVKAVLQDLGLHYNVVELGEVVIAGNLTEEKREQLKSGLLKYGLELMDNKKNLLVEKIKNIIIETIHYSDELPDINFKDYLAEKLNNNYTELANLFSEIKGISIAHFILFHKTERIKELLVYDELTLPEIAFKLNYSSVAHMTFQFKKITGLTPGHFKNMKLKRSAAPGNL